MRVEKAFQSIHHAASAAPFLESSVDMGDEHDLSKAKSMRKDVQDDIAIRASS